MREEVDPNSNQFPYVIDQGRSEFMLHINTRNLATIDGEKREWKATH